MTAADSRYQIVGGPGKFDLMLSLFEKGKQVTFTIDHEGPVIFKVQINSIGAEDASRESWLIEGGIVEMAGASVPWQSFKGYFETRWRRGWIEF